MDSGADDIGRSLDAIARNGAQLIGALRNMRATATGTITLTAAASVTVNDTAVTGSSVILWMPTNASAASLLSGSKNLYLSARSAGTSFTLSTADATNASGGETFNYLIFAPI